MEKLKMSGMVITRSERIARERIAEEVHADIYLSQGYRTKKQSMIVENRDKYIVDRVETEKKISQKPLKLITPEMELIAINMLNCGQSLKATAKKIGIACDVLKKHLSGVESSRYERFM